MISLEHSALLIDRHDVMTANQRTLISDDQLVQAYETGEQLDVVVRPADVAGPFSFQPEITVSNKMTLDKLGINGVMRVLRGGRAEVTILTVPPVEVEGQLVRLSNNNMPVHQELAPDQLTFIPDKNRTYSELDFSSTRVDIR